MTIISLIRLARGVVHFEVRDGFIERFINLCTQGGVPLWDGRRVGKCYTASTTIKDSRRLPDFAARAGVTLEIKGKKGVPPLLTRYRKRAGLFVGAAILLVTMGVMGSFIWQIQVTGNTTLSQEEILTVLDELGIRQGIWRKSVDTRDAERQMMIRLDQLSWVGINLKGSVAYVEVKERVIPPARIDDNVPHNVVASKTGYITYLEVYAGQAMVKVGDSVKAGDILVSGIMEDKEGKARLVHARAKVMAQSEEVLEVTAPYEQEYYTLLSVEKRNYLTLFGLKIPLYWGEVPEEPYKHMSAAYDLPVLSRLMPLVFYKDRYLVLERHTREITPDEARRLAQEELAGMETRELAGMEILSREHTGQELPDGFWLECRYLCREDISLEVRILTDHDALLKLLEEAGGAAVVQ